MRWISPALCLIGLTLCCGPFAIAQETVDVAILPLSDEAADVGLLIEQQLLAEPVVRLVDRAQVQRVMAERSLGLSLTSDAAVWRDLGHIIPADVYVLVAKHAATPESNTSAGTPGLIHLAAVETRTGIVLGGATAEGDLDEAPIEALAERILAAIRKTLVPADERVYMAFLGITADVASAALEREARVLSALTQMRLQVEPAVTLLERHQVALLVKEGQLTGLPPELQTSTLIVRGGLSWEGGADAAVLTLRVVRSEGAVTETSDAFDMANASTSADEIVAKLLQAVSVNHVDAPMMNTHAEADYLRYRSIQLQSYAKPVRSLNPGDDAVALLGDAVAFAEAAAALDPADANRKALVDACWQLADTYYRHPRLVSDSARRMLEAVIHAHEADIQRLQSLIAARDVDADAVRDLCSLDSGRLQMDVARMGKDHPELLRQYRELTLRRLALITQWIASQPVMTQHWFYNNVLSQLRYLAQSPDEWFELGTTYLKLAEQTWHVLLAEGPDVFKNGGGSLLTPAGSPANIDRFSAELPERYLAFLEQHSNPVIRLEALHARVLSKATHTDDAARRLLAVTLAPDSELNHYLDGFDRFYKDFDSAPADAMAWIEDHAGAATMLESFDHYLRLIEQHDDPMRLMRWHTTVSYLIRKAEDDTPPDAALVDVLGRIKALLDANPQLADVRFVGSTRRRWLNRMQAIQTGSEQSRASPWDAYELETFQIDRIASKECKLVAIVPVPAAPNKPLAEGHYLAILRDEGSRGRLRSQKTYYKYYVSADGSDIRELASAVEPEPLVQELGSLMQGTCAVAIAGTVYFSFERTPGLYVMGDDLRIIGEEAGASVQANARLLAVGERLFVAWKGALAEYDREEGRFKFIASARSTRQRSALDNTRDYEISGLVADPSGDAIWFTAHGSGGGNLEPSSGVWRYDLTQERLERCAFADERHQRDLMCLGWVDGELWAMPYPIAPYWIYQVDQSKMEIVFSRPPRSTPTRPTQSLIFATGMNFRGQTQWSQVDYDGSTFAAPYLQLRTPDGYVANSPSGVGAVTLLPLEDGVSGAGYERFVIITRADPLPDEADAP